MEECHKLLTDQVDDAILRYNVSKPLPLGGDPGHVTIQPNFFFNKDLEYLRNLVIRQRVEDFQLGIESYQMQLNLTKPRWDAKGFEYKHEFIVIDSPRAVTFRDNVRKHAQYDLKREAIHLILPTGIGDEKDFTLNSTVRCMSDKHKKSGKSHRGRLPNQGEINSNNSKISNQGQTNFGKWSNSLLTMEKTIESYLHKDSTR
ncbi:hypothetical protein Tco_0483584 [Tanacetum coccineum]